jgi:hypothetical protein
MKLITLTSYLIRVVWWISVHFFLQVHQCYVFKLIQLSVFMTEKAYFILCFRSF